MAAFYGDQSSSQEGPNSCYSDDLFHATKCVLTDQQKLDCLARLHCCVKDVNHEKQSKLEPGNAKGQKLEKAPHVLKPPEHKNACCKTFMTWTSHWGRSNRMSRAAYTLMNVKHWYLTDENYLFDPLSQCKECCFNLSVSTKSKNTLWPSFQSTTELHFLSVDAILHLKLSRPQHEALEYLDNLMDAIDSPNAVIIGNEARRLKNSYGTRLNGTQPFMKRPYREFVASLSMALQSLHERSPQLPQSHYATVFTDFVNCVVACFEHESEASTFMVPEIRCYRDIDGRLLEKQYLDITLEQQEDIVLEVDSKPDIFLYERTAELKRNVIAVIEAKGTINYSVWDSEIEIRQCQNKEHRLKCESDLEEIDEDDDADVKTDLDMLVENKRKPDWLENIEKFPPDQLRTIKKLLPQLMGEMWCCSRHPEFQFTQSTIKSKLGIGVVGFDVYFVSMVDSSEKCQVPDVPDDTADANIFVTRPFRLLSKADRRMIMKILVAAFYLYHTD